LEEFGCTVCHQGRGRGTDFVSAAHTPNSERQKKAWEEKHHWHKKKHWSETMYPLKYTQAGCFKCHSNQTVIKGAEKLNLGLHLIEKSGCYGCHLIEKYNDWSRAGPNLTKLASKVSKEWAYRWIRSPKSFRHNTWMPDFFNQSNTNDPESLRRGQQEIHAIVHYLFENSHDFEIQDMPEEGDAQTGEEIVASLGCFACHNIQSEKLNLPRTRQSLRTEHGPNLFAIGTKTSKAWIYNWLKNPSRYHPQTRMPNLRLTDKEAADVAAYLALSENTDFMTQSIPKVDQEVLNRIVEEFFLKSNTVVQAQLKTQAMPLDEKLHFAGEKLIRRYGCFGCHQINGFENDKPIGTDLSQEGSKSVEKLDFGFVDIEHQNYVWFKQKLLNPRIFDQKRIKAHDEKLKMPNFSFTDGEADAIVTALLGFVKERPQVSKIKERSPQNLFIEEGQKIVRQFNCQGCHILEGEGGAIQPKVVEWLVKYDDRQQNEAEAVVTSFSPPNLIGEGKKVQAQWLFNFLHKPTIVRPWLKTRMPTYSFNAQHLNVLVKYFNALEGEELLFTDIGKSEVSEEMFEAGKKLFSRDYFGCAACHIVGDQFPGGSPDSWAPNFDLAQKRLKPEWIIEWLNNPQDLLPGTKMPTYFDPDNFDISGPDDLLEGDENLQIQALRDYIMNLSRDRSTQESPQPEHEAAP